MILLKSFDERAVRATRTEAQGVRGIAKPYTGWGRGGPRHGSYFIFGRDLGGLKFVLEVLCSPSLGILSPPDAIYNCRIVS